MFKAKAGHGMLAQQADCARCVGLSLSFESVVPIMDAAVKNEVAQAIKAAEEGRLGEGRESDHDRLAEAQFGARTDPGTWCGRNTSREPGRLWHLGTGHTQFAPINQ